jgi:hypothetical protein
MDTTSTTGEALRTTGRRLQSRAAAACGALFTLGIVIGDDTINQAGEPPTPFEQGGDSIAAVERYLAKAADASSDGSYWVGRGIGTLAIVALLVFSAYVAREIRLSEKDTGLLSGIALGAGAVAAAMGLVSCTAQFAAVARASEDIDPEIARALLDVSALTFVLMWLPIAVFMASVAMAGQRPGLLPRWLTIATGVLAAVLLAGLASMPLGSIGFLAIVLAGLWFVAASISLVRRAT